MATTTITKRVITALIIGGLWLWLLFFGSFPLFWMFMTLVAGVVMWEYLAAVLQHEPRSMLAIGVGLGSLPMLASYYGAPEITNVALIVAFLLTILLVIIRYAHLQDPFPILCRLAFGLMLVGFFASHLPLLMRLPAGNLALLFLTAITIAADSTAFFTGKFMGRTPLCPAVSPKKTVEGLIGGMIGAVGAALLVAVLFFPNFSPLRTVILALLLAAISVVGDLAESVVKRWAGVKDSGSLLPGHGGLFDRVDSLLLTAPVFFYLYYWDILRP